jgi:hypothetical protein
MEEAGWGGCVLFVGGRGERGDGGGGGQVFGYQEKGARELDEDAATACLDYAALFPFAEHAADGGAGGAGHFGEVLLGEGEVDQDAAVDALPGPVGKTEEGASDTALYALGGELAVAVLEFEDVGRYDAEDVERQVGEAQYEGEHGVAVPGEHTAIVGCLSGSGVEGFVDEGDGAEGIAGAGDAEQDLVAFGRYLGHLDLSGDQDMESGSGSALPKEVGARSEAAGASGSGDGRQFTRLKPFEERIALEKARVLKSRAGGVHNKIVQQSWIGVSRIVRLRPPSAQR